MRAEWRKQLSADVLTAFAELIKIQPPNMSVVMMSVFDFSYLVIGFDN